MLYPVGNTEGRPGPPDPVPGRVPHRAKYILERGIWLATCQVCGWQTSDVLRSRAMSSFRVHVQDQRDAAELSLNLTRDDAVQATVDIRDIPGGSSGRPSTAPMTSVRLPFDGILVREPIAGS